MSYPEAMKSHNWRTRFGIYLAAMGTACGLGNLWRFPYVVGENGGGAFVLLYVFIALILGMPLMIGELSLGKIKKSSIVGATKSLDLVSGKTEWVWLGRLCLALTLVLLSYYAVISGWVLYFMVQFLKEIVVPRASGTAISLQQIASNGFLQMALTSVHLIFSMIVVGRGVQEGIERSVGALMPLFSILLVFLAYQSLSLPSSPEALRFLFYPNFSELSLSSLIHAIGHVLFTLGVGFGIMTTFGSYLREKDHVPTIGFRLTGIDTVMSFAAGLLVFPIALSASHIPLTDPGLMFESLPVFLMERSMGEYFGFAFFLCLYLAALGASVGLLEVIVSNGMMIMKKPRQQATWYSGLGVLVISFFPALLGAISQNSSHRSILELLDSVLVNWAMPLSALLFCFLFSKGLKKQEMQEIFLVQNKVESQALFPHWWTLIRYGIPGLILLGLVLQIVDFFI